MSKISAALAAIIVTVGAAYGQTSEPQVQGAKQAVGLFMNTCLQYPNNPAALRSFMVDRHVPELNAEGRAIFLKGRSGVGFDATNRFARLALVSEDSGSCTVFADKTDAAALAALIEAALKRPNVEVADQQEKAAGPARSHIYQITINHLPYTFVWSANANQAGAVQAALTLAPKT